MLLHPTRRDVLGSLAGGGHAHINKVAHGLALLGQPLILMGTLVFTLRFSRNREVAIAAYVFLVWASVAVMLAMVLSGFIATDVIASGVRGRTTAEVSASLLHYTGIANRAFSDVYVGFSSLAIGLWSVAVIRGKEFPSLLGAYGLIMTFATLELVAHNDSRAIRSTFTVVVIAQGMWMFGVACLLRRLP